MDTKKNQNGYIWLAFENLLNLNMYMCIFFDKKLVSLCFSVVNNRQLHVYVCFQRPTEQFWTRFCVSPPPPCLTDRSPCWSTTPVSWTLMWSGGTSDRNLSDWTREWGEKTWLYMSGESMCLRIPSGNSSDAPLMNGSTDSTLCLRVHSLTIYIGFFNIFMDFPLVLYFLFNVYGDLY